MKRNPVDPTTPEPPTRGLPLHRRSFLQAAGFSLAAVATGCHRPPPHSSRPYLEAPGEVVAGRPLYYASVCDGCSAGCGTLVKVRDGRPIKLEGLDEHPGSRGGLCAMGQASLLGLYDSRRLRGPLVAGRDATWAEADGAIRSGLAQARAAGRGIRLLTPSLHSPTERAAAARFVELQGAVHVVHDPLSASAILDAHAVTHGRRLLPRYRFERADLIVGLDADFLGTWISPVEFAAGYRAARRPDVASPRPSYHIQLEPTLTLSGCKADRRLTLRPDEIPALISALSHALAPGLMPDRAPEGGSLAANLAAAVADLARQLQQVAEAGGHSLIVSGSDDLTTQVLINGLNFHLGNYAATVDLEHPSLQRQGSDVAFAELVAELRRGEVGALLVAGLDPLHEFEGAGLQTTFEDLDLLVSLSPQSDATAAVADIVCPSHHFLESWGDAEPVEGLLAVRQPTIAPLWNTRSLRAGLDAWSTIEGAATVDDLVALQAYWRQEIHPRDSRGMDFQSFWDRTVHDGVALLLPASATTASATTASATPAFDTLAFATWLSEAWRSTTQTTAPASDTPTDAFTLVLYPKVGLGEGRHADNPWLHELPDPISKVTWGNYACLSPSAAGRLGVKDGDIVRLRAGEAALELPALVQPGQHDDVVAVAMGYGNRRSERFRDIGPEWIGTSPSTDDEGRVGRNGARLLEGLGRVRHGVAVEATGSRRELAKTQQWERSDDRVLVEEVTLQALLAGNVAAEHGGQEHGSKEHGGQKHRADLYPDDHRARDSAAHPARKWGMSIDLDACTGCSACVIACQAENNLPVVGYDEVRRHRDMQWMRIDRYYGASEGATGTEADTLDIAFQPMLCQHCDQAPCETVCPVLATVQTEEGLNAQAYNRCVGTRYCANNCPFKVRRFNWFDYQRDDPVANLVLNPDVVVRSRGVMEKCSFCVQRIENAKIEARSRGEQRVRDDEVRSACQQSCPAKAIVFGDVLDEASQVAASRRDRRGYRLLEELNVQPSVDYLRRVRRRPLVDESAANAKNEATDGGSSHG